MYARKARSRPGAAPAKKPEKKTAEKKTEPAPKPAPGKLPPPPPLKVEWKPAYYKNRAYVPAEQVSTYYDLKPPVESGKSILLKGEGFSLEFTRGEKLVQLNGSCRFLRGKNGFWIAR